MDVVIWAPRMGFVVEIHSKSSASLIQPRWMKGVLYSLFILISACTNANAPRPTPSTMGKAYALSNNVEFTRLEIPNHSRHNDDAPPLDIALNTKWVAKGKSKHNTRKYETVLPFRPRGLFFSRPPTGMSVQHRDGSTIPFNRSGMAGKTSWSFNQKRLTLRVHKDAPVPEAGEYSIRYPTATEREGALNFQHSGIADKADFVRTTIQAEWDSHSGLLLPAPSTAAWDIIIPPSGELTFSAGLVKPEIMDGAPSDGASLLVSLRVNNKRHTLHNSVLKPHEFPKTRIDLSPWTGQDAQLVFETQPGESRNFDYAFIAAPAIATRKENPSRIIFVFIDTLRPDHLGCYGYKRDTSPNIDQFASQSVIFENARSVAPWTLPSARTVLTGRHPEYYENSPTLQGILGAKGWATGMFAGNVYLSSNFDMNRDWDFHQATLFPSAEETTDAALSWLSEHEGRDLLLQVHYMNVHLPYREPESYRYLFADKGPDSLSEEFHRTDVLRAKLKTTEERQYIQDRYDNNIRYIDDELQRLLDTTKEDDIVVLYSDHGEEFWDHGGFEHGHTLFDEVLRVPLIIRAPGINALRITEPVSLLDITPTILEHLGLTSGPTDGQSLSSAMQNDEDAKKKLSQRDITFGRPLYGSERWGVLHDTMKYTTHEGREALYNIQTDSKEEDNLVVAQDGEATAAYRQLLGDGLSRDAVVAYRLVPTGLRTGAPHDLRAVLHIPGGIQQAWVGADPLRRSKATVIIDGEQALVTWHSGYRGSREVYVVPNQPMETVTHELSLEVSYGEQNQTIHVPEHRSSSLGNVRTPLARAILRGRTLALTWAVAPIPDKDAKHIDGFDSELSAMLQAMGYAVGDE